MSAEQDKVAEAIGAAVGELERQAARVPLLEAEIADLKRENYKLREHNGAQDKLLSKLRDNVGNLKDVARFYRAQRDRVDAYLSGVLDTHREERHAARGGLDAAAIDAKLRDVVRESGQMLDRYRSSLTSFRPRVDEPSVRNFRNDDNGRDTYQTYRDQEPKGWEEL